MIIEQLDDLPLLGKIIKELRLPLLYEQHFPDHGHWDGISGGQLLFGWLLYILSEGDHRLSHVEDWAAQRLNTLAAVMDSSGLRQLDFSDDRLARILDKLADDVDWEAFELSIGRQIVQIYRPAGLKRKDEPLHVVRADTFNVPQFRDAGELFRHGYSKQRRDDLPFCKVMVGFVEELSVPLSIDVVKGSGPDCEYYLPAINRIRDMLGYSGNLYVGDSALGTMPNRGAIHAAGNYYLCPLSRKQVTQRQLDEYLDRLPPGPVTDLPGLFTDEAGGRSPVHFFELSEQVSGPQPDTGWEERRILVYSPQYTEGLIKSFYNRLDEAEVKIKNLVVGKKGRRNPTTLAELHTRITKIEEEYQVLGCFNTQCSETRTSVAINRHKDRPARTVDKVALSLVLERNAPYIEKTAARLGWQIYGSNASKEVFTTAQLVELYRDEYSIEHFFNYLLNRDVGLLPVYLKKESRVKALVRLLSVAMKCAMLVQYKVRAALLQKNETLGGIYPGNKGRKTDQPTTPMLLRAFRGIAVVCLSPRQSPQFQMTSLDQTQKTILGLMQDPLLYEQVIALLKPISILSET